MASLGLLNQLPTLPRLLFPLSRPDTHISGPSTNFTFSDITWWWVTPIPPPASLFFNQPVLVPPVQCCADKFLPPAYSEAEGGGGWWEAFANFHSVNISTVADSLIQALNTVANCKAGKGYIWSTLASQYKPALQQFWLSENTVFICLLVMLLSSHTM